MDGEGAGLTFETYVHENWLRLVRAGVLAGLDTAAAEDAAQDCLIVVSARWPRISRMENPEGYVFRVFFNTCRKRLRRSHRSNVPARVLATDEPGLSIETRDLLRDLSIDDRAVLILRHYFSYSEAETAAVLGVKPGTVKSRNSRALKRARHQLDMEDTPK